MRIDPSGLYPSRRPTEATPDTRAGQDAGAVERAGGDEDEVDVSPRARLIAVARRALDETPAVRDEAVDAARERLEAEGEIWDGRDIARAMFDAISRDAA
jgi:cytidylate kinase